MGIADKVIKSNLIFTACDDEPISGAVIVNGNKITAVASDAEVDAYIGAETEVYEYKDQLVMPGLIDAHEHLWWGAVADSPHMVDITSSTSEEEAVQMIKAYADANPQEKRIRGFGWFPSNWNDDPLPTKNSLDEIISDRPVYMLAADAHTGWLNSLALEESGYYPGMELDGGSIGIDENGEMNGLIFEPDALIHAWNKLYAFPEEEVEGIVDAFMAGLASYGVTSISEMSADAYNDEIHKRYQMFQKMADEGKMTSRVHAYTKLMKMTDFTTAKEWAEEFSGGIFKVSGLKGFLDGVASTYTAYLKEPYTDRTDTCGEGVPLATKESLEASVIAGNAAGLPVRIHAIGDAAVAMALDAYECSLRANGNHGLVNTIEHIETADPADIPRFKELGVLASMQGEHIPLDADEKVIRMGPERTRWQWPIKSFLDAGVDVAFGTDYPIVRYNQFVGIYSAITRENYDGTPSNQGLSDVEKITLPQALRANTMGGAIAYSRPDEIGSLEAGKLADIIVLDRALFGQDVSEVKNAKVVLTMMDGKITYKA
ncbi:MAG: amidohydrolase [Firmicutes bacterium]|nr:amidohydrolase [Bacillota bacterium]